MRLTFAFRLRLACGLESAFEAAFKAVYKKREQTRRTKLFQAFRNFNRHATRFNIYVKNDMGQGG